MRAVVQRVRAAAVTVNGKVSDRIAVGLLVFVGIGRDDAQADIDYVANKVRDLRLFDDDAGKMNRSLNDIGGAALVVSEFTLYGDCRRGRRPSFARAAPPAEAQVAYDALILALRKRGINVRTGVFRATMDVELINDGPVTVLLDSARGF